MLLHKGSFSYQLSCVPRYSHMQDPGLLTRVCEALFDTTMVHHWSCAACLLLLAATLLGWQVTAQQATAFLPSGLPAIAEGVTARLVYRMNGFAENWKDPTVRAVYLAGEC